MTGSTLAARVVADRIGRRRVQYLTGWRIAGWPEWSYDHHRADVLRGSDADASRWRELLRRDGIEAHTIREES